MSETSAREPEAAAGEPAAERARADDGRFRCGRCAAELVFAPGTTSLTCEYCGFANEIAPAHEGVGGGAAGAPGIEELDLGEHLARLADGEVTQEVSVVTCTACGAKTDKPPNLDAFECIFCGENIVSAAVRDRIIAPRSLLPFHVTKEQAHQAFRAWIAKRWFAPKKLERYARSGGRLDGVYVPYWTYDSRTVTRYTGQRGEHYWDTEHYTTTENGKTVRKTRRVRRTRWYPASGIVNNGFDDLLVLGSRSLPEAYARKLEPWDLENLVEYREEYLAGLRAERYQIGLEEGFGVARGMMEPAIDQTIRSDIGGDDQRIHARDTQYVDVTFKHLLLPVWISAYRFRDKVYRILVNARTGEVQGERPYSVWKIALLVAGILAGIGVVGAIFALSR